MSRIIQLAVVFTLTAGMSACGKDDAPKTDNPSASAQTSNQSNQPQSQDTAPMPETTAKPSAKKDVTYRPINATLRDSGERIVIMVPDDSDIESGRMLEYRQAEDGTYYLKSVIPQ